MEVVLKKIFPPLYKALGIYLPLITTNCAVLGAALMGIERDYSLGVAVIFGFGVGLGFTVALVLLQELGKELRKMIYLNH